MKAIKAKKIFNGSNFLHDAVIIWENDRIITVDHEDILSKYLHIIYEEIEDTIIPGFVDIQVNGAGGVNFYGEDISIETLKTISTTLRKYGCTSYCPTLITSTDADINKALDLINSYQNLSDLGILGLHIEGPMFSQEHKGAHNPDLIRVLSQELIDKICQSKVKIISLSPEVAPLEYIQQLSQSGVSVSVAHSNATLEETRRAEQYGASLGTHLYNGMSRFASREPNVVGALLTSKTIASSIIPDGNHCDFESVILAHKCLGDRLITITDGILAMGTDLKKFKLGFQNVYINEKNQCIGDYGGLAGSIVTPIKCLQNLVNFCEFSLSEAIASYTSIPAKHLGLTDSVGNLKSNNYADFSILNESTLSLKKVFFKGKMFSVSP